jgi:hypothetical protein
MRKHQKPFAIERKRRVRGRRHGDGDSVNARARKLDLEPRTVAPANRIFAAVTESVAVEPKPVPNRILPDLTAPERVLPVRVAEASMPAKERPGRATMAAKQPRTRKSQRRPNSRASRREAHSAATESVGQRPDEVAAARAAMPAAAPAMTSEKGPDQARVRAKAGQKWSSRELRRAAARGAIKIGTGAGRNRRRR